MQFWKFFFIINENDFVKKLYVIIDWYVEKDIQKKHFQAIL